MTPKFKYVGWFCLAPVVMTDPAEEPFTVASRYEWLEWWFSANTAVYAIVASLADMVNPRFVPGYKFRITGEVKHAD